MEAKLSDAVKTIVSRFGELDSQKKAHCLQLVSALLACYEGEEVSAVVLLQAEDLQFVTVNATRMEAASMIFAAQEAVTAAVLEDAPPKDQFN